MLAGVARWAGRAAVGCGGGGCGTERGATPPRQLDLSDAPVLQEQRRDIQGGHTVFWWWRRRAAAPFWPHRHLDEVRQIPKAQTYTAKALR